MNFGGFLVFQVITVGGAALNISLGDARSISQMGVLKFPWKLLSWFFLGNQTPPKNVILIPKKCTQHAYTQEHQSFCQECMWEPYKEGNHQSNVHKACIYPNKSMMLQTLVWYDLAKITYSHLHLKITSFTRKGGLWGGLAYINAYFGNCPPKSAKVGG